MPESNSPDVNATQCPKLQETRERLKKTRSLCGVQSSCNQFGNLRTSTFKFLSRTACLKKQDAGMHTPNAKPAERLSVSKATVKGDTTAIITSHCQSKPNKFKGVERPRGQGSQWGRKFWRRLIRSRPWTTRERKAIGLWVKLWTGEEKFCVSCCKQAKLVKDDSYPHPSCFFFLFASC